MLLEGLWGAKEGPGTSPGGQDRTTERGRGEVNSPQGDIGDEGNGERGPLNHWTPQRGWWDLELARLVLNYGP